jgi:multidrug efflux pump
MNLSERMIERPIATTLLTLGLALSGVLALRLLPISQLPQIDFPTIQVTAALPGASAETMATAVAAPLERQFGRIAALSEMTSSSQLGVTSVVLQFDLSRDIDGAARDVQAAINAARPFLPASLPTNPSYRKINPAEAPIIILALTSRRLDPPRMYDVASTVLQQTLSQVEGVGQVIVGGSSLPAVRVELNPWLLNRYGVGLDQVRAVLSSANANRPKGTLDDGARSWALAMNDQMHEAAPYRSLVVNYRAGTALRLSDVAQVSDSQEDLRNAGFVQGAPAVMLIVFRQPGANVIATVDRVRALIPRLRAALPPGVELSVVLDRSPIIRASLHDVERALVIAAVLVVLVVFAFLRSARATLIPAVAVPVSLISTFGVMYLAGFSLDNLSLMALTVATGFVVDDAIVVLENTSRHLEAGMPARQAASRGAREIAFTVISMSLSLVAVFLPILLMGGMLGRLFREFAVTLASAVLLSMLLSLTTTPMMCALLLRPASARARRGPGVRLLERVQHAYDASLGWALRHAPLMLALVVVTLASNVVLYKLVPKGFFPQQDTGRLTGTVQGDQDISFQALRDQLVRIEAIIRQDPAVDSVSAFIGGTGGAAGARNTARMFIGLHPLARRHVSADQVIARLRKRLAAVPGVAVYLQATQDLRVGGYSSAAQYQFTLQAEDLNALYRFAPRLEQRLRALPQLVDVNSDLQSDGLQVFVDIDRATASRFGIHPQLIDDTLYDAFGQRQVSTIYAPLNQYHVVMEVAPAHARAPSDVEALHVRAPNGGEVPLRALARITPSATALSVNHRAQMAAVTFSFNLAPGSNLGEAIDRVQASAAELGMPKGVHTRFSGTAQAFQQSLADEPLLVLAALVAVYVVLGILYESYVHPITILSTLPSAGTGALLALLVTGMNLDVVALIGIILLIGIVKKNGIMMVDFALDAERNRKLSAQDAVREASLLRFRPIMMTTLAALLGALPLALGHGVGAEVRRPLGVAIVGGLLASQLLTLYTTPVVYLYADRVRGWAARRRRKRDEPTLT